MTLIRCESGLALAEQVAAAWLDELASASPTVPYTVGLSGGRIAVRFFDATATQAQRRGLSLGQVEFFWADERSVPPTDPESNFRLAQEHLLAPLGIKPARVHRVLGELDSRTAAIRAEAELRSVATLNSERQPVLDLVFLGMGEDGHVASLFPNELEEAIDSKAVYRAVVGPKPPPQRVTLSYRSLADARQVWVLVSGPGKEEALRRSLEEGGKTPLARLLRRRTNTSIFTDVLRT